MAKDNVLEAVLEMKNLAKDGLADFRKDVKKSATEFKKEFEQLRKSVGDVENAVKQTGQSTKGFAGIVGGVFKGMLSAVTAFATSITALGSIFRGLSSIARGVFRAIRGAIKLAISAVKSMISYVKGAVVEWMQLGDDLDSLSVRLQISTTALQEWAFVARAAGFSAQSLYKALEQMVKRVAEADEGLGVTAEALDAMGLSAKALMQLDADEQLKIIVSALGDVEIQAKRVQYAFDIFGKSGTALTQLLALTSDQVNDLVANLHNLGAVMSKEDIKASNELRVEIMQIEAAFKGLRHTIARVATPILKDFAVRAKGYLLDLRPVIEGVFQALPEAAKVAFDFVKKHAAFSFKQTGAAMWAVASFIFKEIGDILVATIDAALITLEDRWKTRFGNLRSLLTSLGIMAELESDKLLTALEEARKQGAPQMNILGGPDPLLGGGGRHPGAAGQVGATLIDAKGNVESFSIMVDGVLQKITAVRSETGKLMAFTVEESGKAVRRVSVDLSDLMESAGTKLKNETIKNVSTLKEELKKVWTEQAKDGASIASVGQIIIQITEKHIDQQKEIAKEQGKRRDFVEQQVGGFGRLVAMAKRFKEALQEKAEDVFGITAMIDKLKEWWGKIKAAMGKDPVATAVEEDLVTYGAGLKKGVAEAGEAFSPFNRGMELARQGIQGLYGSLESFFMMAITNSSSLKDSLKALGAQLLQLGASMALRSGLNLAFGSALAPAQKASGGVIAGEIKSFAARSGAPIRGASQGMIAEKPELMEVGEGGRYEAIVPMEGNRFVPVRLHVSGGKGGGGGLKFNFAPQTIVQGNADEQMILRLQRDQERRMVPLVRGMVREMVGGGDADTVRGIRTQAGFAL